MRTSFGYGTRGGPSAPVVNPLQETPQRRSAMDFRSSSWNLRDSAPRNKSSRNIFADLLELELPDAGPSNRLQTQSAEVHWLSFFSKCTPEMQSNLQLAMPQAPRKSGNKKLDRSKLRPKKLSYTAEELTPTVLITDTYNSVYFNVDYQHLGGSTSNKSVRVFHENSNHQNGTPNRTLAGEQARSAKDFASAVSRGTDGQLHSSNKENDSPTPITVHNNVTRVDSSIALKPNVTKPCEVLLDSRWDKVIEWLQPQRDTGIWIECCHKTCKKWRYVEEYHDPCKVPKYWYCWMQRSVNNGFRSCNDPESQLTTEVSSELIENKYNAGSIVLAHIRNSPWWPAIVCDSPTTLTYFKIRSKSIIPYQYFVVYFDRNVFEHSWVKPRSLKSFHSNKAPPKLTKQFQEIYGERLKESYKLAEEAENLSITERLKKFDYLAWFKKVNNIDGRESCLPRQSNSDLNDFIPATPTKVCIKRRKWCLDN